jgi:hypothetical protein
MKVAYVAGPYRGGTIRGTVENIRSAEAVALELWRMGFAVICPHLNTCLFDGALPDSVWLEGDLAILARCDVVVLAPGWEASEGARAEAVRAEESGIPVLVWPRETAQVAALARA